MKHGEMCLEKAMCFQDTLEDEHLKVLHEILTRLPSTRVAYLIEHKLELNVPMVEARTYLCSTSVFRYSSMKTQPNNWFHILVITTILSHLETYHHHTSLVRCYLN